MDVKIAATALLSVIFMIIIIILAAVYGGDDANCDSFYAAKDAERAAKDAKVAAAKLAAGPAMVHFPQIKDTKLEKLTDTSATAYMKTIGYSMVGSKDMQASLLRLEKGPALMYTHWYESILFVISGSFSVSNGTGRFIPVGAQQSLMIPRGAEISYQSLVDSSLMYIVMQPPTLERAIDIQKAMAKNPTSSGYPELSVIKPANTMKKDTDLKFFGDPKGGDKSYLTDFLFSTVKDAGMTGGLYKLFAGPHLLYPYPYEEFKYIVDGEYHLTDGTGQKVKAKAGDLMYFPKNCTVRFETPGPFGYGFYVGQRAEGEA